MAGATRLELATSGVTGRRSNQLSYAPSVKAAKRPNLFNLQFQQQKVKFFPIAHGVLYISPEKALGIALTIYKRISS